MKSNIQFQILVCTPFNLTTYVAYPIGRLMRSYPLTSPNSFVSLNSIWHALISSVCNFQFFFQKVAGTSQIPFTVTTFQWSAAYGGNSLVTLSIPIGQFGVTGK